MIETGTRALNSGPAIPILGLGVWRVPQDVAAANVAAAIGAGYRLVDTATVYQNEEGVGEGIRRAGLARDALFVTTKLWNADQGHDSALRAFDASMARLGLETLDLYLIHWPCPRKNLYVESWKALIRLRDEGRVRAIGVSNFLAPQLERIIAETGVTPALNQIECHPRFQRRDVRAFCDAHGIVVQSWSPLGQGGASLDHPVLARIAAKHGRSAAQIVLRWHLDEGLVAIPKAIGAQHMRDNIALRGFALDTGDMAAIRALDDPAGRIGPTPDDDSTN